MEKPNLSMSRRDFLTVSGVAVAATGSQPNALAEVSSTNSGTSEATTTASTRSLLAERVINYSPPARTVLEAKFRVWHVESLLNQAADLIERCISQLQEYRSLDYAWNQSKIDLYVQTEELGLDQARKEEFKRDIIVAERRAKFMTDSQSGFDTSIAEAQKLYNYGVKENQGFAGWTKAGQNIGEKRIEKEARSLEQDLTQHQLTWATSDAKYKQKRLDIRAEAIERRKKLLADGQPFTLAWQRDLVGERLERDYQDALNRARVAEDGLREIYGHEEGSSRPPDGLNTMDETITHVAKWIRNSIEWLVAFQQLDQAFTRVVSVRSLLGQNHWEQVRAARGPVKVPLRIPIDLFAGHEHIRLRGIGAALLGKVGAVPWSVVVQVPKKAVYIRSGQRKKFDQGDIPLCLLGRVENRQSLRPLEICGAISLMNASPIGQFPVEGADLSEGSWWIEINKPTGTSESFEHLDDLLIEINVVGIPKIGG